MSQDQTVEPTEASAPAADAVEAPAPEVMQAVAEALEATETGEATTITKVEGAGEPLLPRRGS